MLGGMDLSLSNYKKEIMTLGFCRQLMAGQKSILFILQQSETPSHGTIKHWKWTLSRIQFCASC